MKKTIAALLGAGLALSASPAFAGPWLIDPYRCPDLREDHRDRAEDRRDTRYTRGPVDRVEDRLDRRENRRDRNVAVCPRGAYVHAGHWH